MFKEASLTNDSLNDFCQFFKNFLYFANNLKNHVQLTIENVTMRKIMKDLKTRLLKVVYIYIYRPLGVNKILAGQIKALESTGDEWAH